jgi:hypothetical protein
MNALTTAYQAGVNDALLKLGATRGVREIRKAMSAGNMGRANQIAADPRVFSPGQMTMGSALPGNAQHLGRGGEGLSTKVVHPAAAQHNIATGSSEGPMAVRKLFDPAGGVFSPEVARRKAEELHDMPGMPKVLATGQTRSGSPVHINELVPGRKITEKDLANPAFQQQFDQEREKTLAAGRARGYELADLRPGNALATPSGPKFIDAYPLKPSEALSPAAQIREHGDLLPSNVLPFTREARSLLTQSRAAQKTTPAHLQNDIPIGAQTAGLYRTDRPAFDAKIKSREAENHLAFTQHMLGRPGSPQPAPAYQPTPTDRLREQLARRNYGNAGTVPSPPRAPNPSSVPPQVPALAPTAASPGRRPRVAPAEPVRHTGMSDVL